MSMSLEDKLKQGPKEGVTYPIHVVYCGNCSMPIEYCEYYPEYEKCKQWLEVNLPTEFEKVKIGDDNPVEEEKKRQKRGGKGMIKTKKKEDGPKQVYVSRAPRGKKKSVTVVTGLSSFEWEEIHINLPSTLSMKELMLSCKKENVQVKYVICLKPIDIDLKVAAKFFGTKFACGSSVTGDDEIVIQGDVKDDLFDVIPEKWSEIDEDFIEDLGDQKR